MSFSWSCRDTSGKDLFEEFEINSQALCFCFDGAPRTTEQIREAFASVPYKESFEQAARDALSFAQALVMENINHAAGPAHLDCPCCTCKRREVRGFHWDIEQARRFCKIPLIRVHRCSGGW